MCRCVYTFQYIEGSGLRRHSRDSNGRHTDFARSAGPGLHFCRCTAFPSRTSCGATSRRSVTPLAIREWADDVRGERVDGGDSFPEEEPGSQRRNSTSSCWRRPIPASSRRTRVPRASPVTSWAGRRRKPRSDQLGYFANRSRACGRVDERRVDGLHRRHRQAKMIAKLDDGPDNGSSSSGRPASTSCSIESLRADCPAPARR